MGKDRRLSLKLGRKKKGGVWKRSKAGKAPDAVKNAAPNFSVNPTARRNYE